MTYFSALLGQSGCKLIPHAEDREQMRPHWAELWSCTISWLHRKESEEKSNSHTLVCTVRIGEHGTQ